MNMDGFVAWVIDQLAPLPVTARAMFGGHGLYLAGRIFAVADDGVLYLKTDEAFRSEFESRGSRPFEYAPGKVLKTYYELPADVADDTELFKAWAQRSAAVEKPKRATQAKKAKQPVRKAPARNPRPARTRARGRP